MRNPDTLVLMRLGNISARLFMSKPIMIGTVIYFLTIATTFAQNSIRGKVTDASTGEAISDASVYLPEQHRGIATDQDGVFSIVGVKHGKILLQITHVGYESHIATFTFTKDTTMNVTLLPSRLQMKEVVVTGASTLAPGATTYNIVSVTANDMMQLGTLSLSDAVAKLPGITQLTTGVGISKPVIRGLYGNRIQVNVNGMRFDNQQWQDEHGLGLSEMGVDRVEIIKGPASVLYGSDAIGGVMNVIEEKPAPQGELQQDLNVKLFSNTFGTSLNHGIKKSRESRWWKIRAGLDSHADYSDGNNNRVLNSRFAGYNLKASIGFDKPHWSNANNVFVSYSKFGFVFDSLNRKEEDGRLSRSFDGPHHQVFIGQASSENTFFRDRKKVKLNLGLISNLRQEDEGGGGISLSMLLNSLSLLSQVERPVGEKSQLTYGLSLFFQSNTNYGGRIIVPNAITGDLSGFVFYRTHLEKLLFEAGVRYDRKFISTRATGSLNVIGSGLSPTDEIVPFNNWYNAFNGSVGVGYSLAETVSVKLNASSGYRPGNLAELSSNGLHEGTLRWEIGKPDAKIEQNLNTELSVDFHKRNFKANLSVYRNQFWNYIYLAPTGDEYFGFQIFRYQQSDAVLSGGELSLQGNPFTSWFEWSAAYNFIQAEKTNGENLPFIPANRLTGGLTFHLNSRGQISSPSVNVEGVYTFQQDHPGEFETSTSDYFLLNAGATANTGRIRFSLRCNNLLNLNYYDHLSRFKYYGIHNAGRSIVLSMKFTL